MVWALVGPRTAQGAPGARPRNAATVRGAACLEGVLSFQGGCSCVRHGFRRLSASRENPKKRKLFFVSRRLQPILPLSSSVHQTMDLDAVCAHCALSPALSLLVKYVETGRTAANTATNKPSKRKNELLGATWMTELGYLEQFNSDNLLHRERHQVLNGCEWLWER